MQRCRDLLAQFNIVGQRGKLGCRGGDPSTPQDSYQRRPVLGAGFVLVGANYRACLILNLGGYCGLPQVGWAANAPAAIIQQYNRAAHRGRTGVGPGYLAGVGCWLMGVAFWWWCVAPHNRCGAPGLVTAAMAPGRARCWSCGPSPRCRPRSPHQRQRRCATCHAPSNSMVAIPVMIIRRGFKVSPLIVGVVGEMEVPVHRTGGGVCYVLSVDRSA